MSKFTEAESAFTRVPVAYHFDPEQEVIKIGARDWDRDSGRTGWLPSSPVVIPT
ncbi:hypothetical protein ABJI51_34565 [Amycolatopsis sp. NEAU-NG30]|uniref:Uncharacterized protein n=1 Tax=Amycolatopsis melonis TaxID=3156488 RepID=A0ABV0LPZ7_9PSEU